MCEIWGQGQDSKPKSLQAEDTNTGIKYSFPDPNTPL